MTISSYNRRQFLTTAATPPAIGTLSLAQGNSYTAAIPAAYMYPGLGREVDQQPYLVVRRHS
jgi:hypothetical protein